jgi:hypothetical protein
LRKGKGSRLGFADAAGMPPPKLLICFISHLFFGERFNSPQHADVSPRTPEHLIDLVNQVRPVCMTRIDGWAKPEDWQRGLGSSFIDEFSPARDSVRQRDRSGAKTL